MDRVRGAPFVAVIQEDAIEGALAIGGELPLDVWVSLEANDVVRAFVEFIEEGRSSLLARAEAAFGGTSSWAALGSLLLAKTRDFMKSYEFVVTESDARLRSAHWSGYMAVACAVAFDTLIARLSESISANDVDGGTTRDRVAPRHTAARRPESRP